MPKISVGRSDEDFEEHGLKGTGVIGRHLVGENEEAHKANPIHFDLAKPHVVGLFGKRGTGKCLLPGQKIVTQNGLEDIEKVFERGRDKGESAKVTRSEELYFCDGDTVQSISSRFESKSNDITAVYRKRVDEKLVKITTSSGRTVKVTQDHPLLSLSGWRNSETFSKGERIAVPRSIDLEFSDKNLSIPDDLEEAGSGSLKGRERRLPESREGKLPDPSEGTGYFHEEPGTAEDEVFIHEESGAVSLTQKGKKVLEDRKKEDYSRSGKSRPIKSPKEVSEELAEFLSLLMAEGHEQKTTKKNYRIIFTSENHRLLKRFEDLGEELFGLEFSEMDENSIYTNSRALEELLRCNGYPTSENSFNREVPNFILASRKEVNREFLQKYFDLEGHVTDRQIELSTDSRDIADSITYMLLRFGIVAGVTVKEKYVANTEESKVREHFQLTVSGTQNLKNFKENIDFSIDKKSDKLSKIIEDSNKNVDTVPCGNIIKRCRKKMGADRTQVSEHRESLKAYEDGGTPPRRDKLDQIVEDLRSHHRKVSELFEKTKKEEKIDAAEDLVEVSNVRWKELITEPDISGSEEHLSHEKYRNNPEKIIGPLTDLFESKHDLEESRRLLRKLERLADSDIYWDEIEKIEEIDYEGWVYDITVEENHSFVGGFGGVYCHNSYSMGTLAEELQTSDVSDNCSTIIIDPMGIYWSMKRPNDRAATMLEDWGLNPDA
ncbi:MAG: LAGLIDADG family homing endonuclease, partial [Candidatus Nanohaloarchaea archaeon]